MSKHTPTPWRWEDGAFYGEDNWMIDFNGETSPDENYANHCRHDREFIVRAVNNFEALLEAAREVIEEHDHPHCQNHCKIHLLKMAIAEAEKQP